MLSRLAAALARSPQRLGVAALLLTALLAVPLLTMAPTSSASQEPTGPAFDARDVLDERLSPDIAQGFFLVEAAGAAASVSSPGDAADDVLAPAQLRELDRRVDEVRRTQRDILVTVTDQTTGLEVDGALTLADVVDATLAAQGTSLQDAPDEAVRQATTAVVDQQGPVALGLSEEAARDDDGTWTSPALVLSVLLDNGALGGGNGGAVVGSDDLTREETLREVRDVLRGGEPGADVTRDAAGPLVAHAIAADVNLTAAEQGEAAGPFIGLTVLLTVLLVGFVFRSYWHLAVVGSGVAMLMVWLLGLSNLVGLEQDQILSIIVPIALVSFGVDFAFHALGRVREEQEGGRAPRAALATGLAGVGGALLLALASDTAAFLSNVFSGIESIVQFGVAASLGLASAFLLLGVAAPAMEVWVAERVPAPTPGRRSTALRVVAGFAAASAAMGAVLLTVFVAPGAGVVLTLLHPLLFVALPAWLRSRRDGAPTAAAPAAVSTLHDSRVAALLGRSVAALSRRGAIVLPVALLVTALAATSALRIETAFDVEDFFAQDTDFVAGLDALDRHVATTSGEPTPIVVQTDLTDPAALSVLAAEVDALRALDGPFARDDDGGTIVGGGVVDLLRDAVAIPAARAAVEASGTTLVDGDGDGIPDTREGVEAVYATATTTGLPLEGGGLAWAPSQLAPVLDLGAGDQLDATRLQLQLPGSREVTVVETAAELLDDRSAVLSAELSEIADGSTATATGAPVVRQRSLDAVSRALTLSLPIALLVCLLVALVAMRSLRQALVAIVPIMLVVPWLYGLMHALGYSINLVTGTIGAISIGIGIDFAIHMVQRFREEVGHGHDRDDAMRRTGAGTGVALVASAGSSVIGFAVLSFAPMPLFASYGLLTAIMVAMALVATLLVLPALLRIATPAAPVVTRRPHEPVGIRAGAG